MEIVSYINVFFMDLVVMKLILEYYEVFLGLGKYKFIKVKLIVNEDIYFVVYKQRRIFYNLVQKVVKEEQ